MNKKITGISLFVGVLITLTGIAFASSHREAPLTAGDPKIDATDLYAFVSPDNKNMVTLIANYIPFEEPAGGPNFDSFDDKALYEIKIDNNGDSKPDIIYQFKFKTTIGNPNTFLYNVGPINSLTDPNWNIKQTYTLTRIDNASGTGSSTMTTTVLGTDLPMPPVNIGPKSTPNYSNLQASSLNNLPNGGKVFAGQSDDPFFADLGALFDLLSIRKLPGNAGGGVNTLQGYNVHSLALQIPINQLTSNKAMPTDSKDPKAVIGIWTTASRQSTNVLGNGTINSSGNWVQVSRLGNPLVNEVVIPVGSKDLFNSSKPENDAQFANAVTDPEVGKLLKGIYNIKVPPQGPFGSSTQRDDLISIFLTGIPNLTKSEVATPAEELRLNVAIPPTPQGQINNLGVIGGDVQGYPNGRRLTDDVIDISLRAIAGAAYPLFHPGFVVDPTGAKLGDGVDSNDLPFRSSFPYLALPQQGYASMPHGGATIITSDAGNTGSGNSGGMTGGGNGTTTGSGGNGDNNGGMNGTSTNATGTNVFTACNISARSIRLGYINENIKCLQNFLKNRGFLNITFPTNTFGSRTQDAFNRYQISGQQ